MELKQVVPLRLPRVAALLALLLLVGLTGCETLMNAGRTPEERAILDFTVQDFRIGQNKQVLANWENVDKLPGFVGGGYEEFNLLDPLPQISKLALFFRNDVLRRMEVRYFNGPTTSTLRRAGGWKGILEHIQARYGPPTKTGPGVRVVSTQPGLRAQYAKFNGVWEFPSVARQLNFIAMEDSAGGVAVVTVSDTTPEVRRAAAVVRVVEKPPASTTTDVVPPALEPATSPRPAPQPTPVPPPPIPDPGF